MKDVIVIAEKSWKNKKLMTMKNADKIVMADIVKMWNIIDLGSKHNWAINNTGMDLIGDLELIDIKNIEDALAKFKTK